ENADCFHADLLRDLYEIGEMRCVGKKQNTKDTYWVYIENFRKWYMQNGMNCSVHQVGHLFLKDLMKKCRKNTTYNNYRRALDFIFDDLIEFYKKKYLVNPFKNIRRLPEAAETKKWFSKQQQLMIKNTIIANKDDELWLACQLQYYCFVRPGEILEIQLGHIIWDRQKLLIKSSSAKNNLNKYIPVPEIVMRQLQSYKDLPEHWYLFSPAHCPGVERYKLDSLSKRHAKILKKLKMPRGYTFYSWKNTGAVELVKNGTHMKTICMLMRHSKIETTDIYLQSLGLDDLINEKMIHYSEI
ncbi:MAG TPA: site-specific integrase, partial [Chitinophagaceae bacterium]|nr:site-specific integrase [Chitinophagaceae bacterium]